MRKLSARAAVISALAALLTVSLPASPALADDDSDEITGKCPGAEPAKNSEVDTKSPEYGEKDPMIQIAKIGSSLAYDLGSMLGHMLVDEAAKGSRVDKYVADVQDCFPGYNIMVAQPKSLTTQEMKGMLVEKTVRISHTTYRVYVFKSGKFHKDGDLGYKNWGYSGYFDQSEKNHTVKFSTHPSVTRDSDWYSSSQGEKKPMSCEVNGVTAPDSDMQMAVGSGSDDERAQTNEKLLGKAMHCWPSHNILLLHEGGSAEFKGTDSLKMSNGDPAYKKKFNIGNRTFWLYVTDTGKVTSKGDGGWLNWGYGGTFQSDEAKDGRTVKFTKHKEADLNPKADFLDSTSDFVDPKSVKCAGNPPDGDGSWPQRIESQLSKCYKDSNILVVKNLNDIQFSKANELKHVYHGGGGLHDGNTTYDGFILKSGGVLNTGDGGYKNWAFSGKFSRSSDSHVSFSSSSDDGDDDEGKSDTVSGLLALLGSIAGVTALGDG